MDPLLAEFLVESRDSLEHLDRDLIRLETEPDDRATVGRIFRGIHTIKGTCGFLSYPLLESVAHAGESLLSRLRDGRLRCTADITNALLAMVDTIKRLLLGLEATGEEPDEDCDELISRLLGLADSGPAAPSARLPDPPTTMAPPNPVATESAHSMPQTHPGTSELFPVSSVPPGLTPESVVAPPEPSDATVRLDVRLLDTLLNQVGELVLTRNQMLDATLRRDLDAVSRTVHYLDSVTTLLQRTVAKTRMQPISNLWNKFNRMVRDLAQTCGKQVQLELVGGDTELDRSLLEAIRDPLTHLVRNAVDHGLEPPAVRAQQGKPPAGRLTLSASHRSGQIHIEISDDGRGINLASVKATAIDKRLVSAAQADAMSDLDILHLIFLPGFSTAEQVTHVSGRGVGMDVVLSNVSSVGGTIDIDSRVGHGTVLRLKIPLTLAIIPALMVRSGSELYAIPQVNLVELLRFEGAALTRAVEPIAGAPLLRLRGRLLPIVDLSSELGRGPVSWQPDTVLNMVVLQADLRQFALVVDGVRDVMEIVVKPLGRLLKPIPIYAGATLSSDGTLILILDVPGLAQRARIISESDPEPVARWQPSVDAHSAVLVVLSEAGDRVVMPMDHMLHVDTLNSASIERSNSQEVMVYEQGILPLLRLNHILGYADRADPTAVNLVACQVDGRRFGLLVHRVVDVVDQCIEVKGESTRTGIRRRVVVDGKVAEELDMALLASQAFPFAGGHP